MEVAAPPLEVRAAEAAAIWIRWYLLMTAGDAVEVTKPSLKLLSKRRRMRKKMSLLLYFRCRVVRGAAEVPRTAETNPAAFS